MQYQCKLRQERAADQQAEESEKNHTANMPRTAVAGLARTHAHEYLTQQQTTVQQPLHPALSYRALLLFSVRIACHQEQDHTSNQDNLCSIHEKDDAAHKQSSVTCLTSQVGKNTQHQPWGPTSPPYHRQSCTARKLLDTPNHWSGTPPASFEAQGHGCDYT